MKYISLLLLLITLQSVALPAPQIRHIVVFGDSLSDAGYADLTPRPKGKMATYSNGPVWPQYLSQMLTHTIISANNRHPLISGKGAYVSGTLNGFDYAAGGATTYGKGISFAAKYYEPPSLEQQVTQFLKYRKPNAHTVYIIWAGANDLFRVYWKHKDSRWKMFWAFFPALEQADATIIKQVMRLHAAGAKHIVVIAVPNIVLTPLLNHNWVAKHMYGFIVSRMNNKLQAELQQLKFPTLYIRVNKVFNQILHETDHSFQFDGTTFKFSNTTSPACLPNKKYRMLSLYCRYPANANSYFFADKLHPTTIGHKLLATDIAKQILTKLQ